MDDAFKEVASAVSFEGNVVKLSIAIILALGSDWLQLLIKFLYKV